jgi:hypothetical protein
MRKTYNLVVDSRNRDTQSSRYNPSFHLNTGIHGIVSVRMVSSTVINNLYNINEDNNTFDFSATIQRITPGHYSGSQLVTVMSAWPEIVSATYDTATGVLTYEVNVGFTLRLATSSAHTWFGYNKPVSLPAGVHTTQPNLTGVSLIQFHTDSLNPATGNSVVAGRSIIISPAGYIHQNRASYLGVYTQEDQTGKVQHFSGIGLNSLSFLVVDASTGRILTEISDWALQLEITTI